ncbi:MAG: hypothetical protein ACKOXT_04385 [Actinomycetota bacterium]
MGKKFWASSIIVLALALTGCSATEEISQSPTPDPTPTIDQQLVPSEEPKNVETVDSNLFLTSYGDIVFKVGEGPTWCTISEFDDFVICEHREFDATYLPLPVPADCEFTYGYQIRLLGSSQAGKAAEFTCANAAWSDASMAPILEDGQRIEAFGFSCFVEGTAARCENQSGDYIVLGPDVWALSE